MGAHSDVHATPKYSESHDFRVDVICNRCVEKCLGLHLLCVHTEYHHMVYLFQQPWIECDMP